MIKSVPATQLARGNVMALPMGRTATITDDPKIGTKFVSFKTEYGSTRVEKHSEVLLEVETEAAKPKKFATVYKQRVAAMTDAELAREYKGYMRTTARSGGSSVSSMMHTTLRRELAKRGMES
jgi:hypothetical protein